MSSKKQLLLKKSLNWHKILGWSGGVAIFIFALSGITHPIMSWTGPKAVSFFPPQAKISTEHLQAIPNLLSLHNINRAIAVKIIPAEQGVLLQVTEHNDQARRYFDINSKQELKNHDPTQAQWLARYYTGLADTAITAISFQTEFDEAYPWVNRLLPVYRVEFDTPDHRIAFVYTELGALASITNDWKTFLQSIFRTFHTSSWLNDFEQARVILMLILLFSLLGMAATGTALIFSIKPRKITHTPRRWHRTIAYLVWFPLLTYSASGTYHLLQYAYGDNHRGLQLGEAFNVQPQSLNTQADWTQTFNANSVNAISLIQGPNHQLLYRLSHPQGKPGQNIKRAQHFSGQPIEKSAQYFDALTGKITTLNDKTLAIYFGQQQLGFSSDKILATKLVTRFGPNYDFRNKRLPVWQIDYDTTLQDRAFIDPSSGFLVDRLTKLERYESYFFSFLHKWNFLVPLIGRGMRDLSVVLILCAAIGFMILGYSILISTYLKQKCKNRTLIKQ